MAKTYTDYIVVNVENYQALDNKTGNYIPFCSFECLPVVPKNALKIDDAENGIFKYSFTTYLPYKTSRNKLIGLRVLCEKNEAGVVKIKEDENVTIELYDRCKNLAKTIDTYYNLCEFYDDYDVIDLISDELYYMLSKRLVEVFESQNNKAAMAYCSLVLNKLRNAIDTHDNIEKLVDDLKVIDKEYYKRPEYVIIDDEDDEMEM